MVRLDSSAPTFAQDFARLLTVKREIAEDVDEAVRGIIAGVVSGGVAVVAGEHAAEPRPAELGHLLGQRHPGQQRFHPLVEQDQPRSADGSHASR